MPNKSKQKRSKQKKKETTKGTSYRHVGIGVSAEHFPNALFGEELTF
ncbi:MAG: hypothetical protein P4L67_05280 [Candidatus Pacebacteria bacterium]|nr:hypothetical protein [Candidatus Paceibacterota bacterium]